MKIIPVGMEVCRSISPELTRHVFFNFVRDDEIGLRIQPALGVTFSSVSAARDAVSPRHPFTVDAVTGFVFLNDVLDSSARNLGGWLFERIKPLQPALDNFLTLVDDAVQRTGFFESLMTVDDYITAIETGRWSFFSVMPTYLYALIASGEVGKAKKLAGEHRAKVLQAAADRGFVQRESDTLPYDQILCDC